MSSSEKWDKFVSEPQWKIKFEVRKTNFQEFEEATKIAMRVEAAFSGVSLLSSSNGSKPVVDNGSPPTLIETENTQVCRSLHGQSNV